MFNINNDSKNVIQPEKKEEVIVIHVDTGAENDNESHHTAADILREIKDENCGPQSNQVSLTMPIIVLYAFLFIEFKCFATTRK